jgi:hypothetical protein
MRAAAARRAAAAAHPGEPWLADHCWDPAGAEDDSRRRLAAALGLSAFLAVLLVPFHWVALVEPPGPFAAALWWGVVGLFDLVLASTLIDAVRRLAHWLRFGASRVRFDRFPFFLGETADLCVRLAPALAAAPGLTLRLRCVEERREGRPYRTVAYEVYGDTRTVEPSTLDGPGAELAASFPLPTGDLGTRLAADPARYWELAARAGDAPWAGFEATFLVPVYARPSQPA